MRKRDPKPGQWKYVVGEGEAEITAYERADKGLRIYTRRRVRGKYETRTLCEPIRDARGRIDAELEIQAQQAAVLRHRSIVLGIDETEAEAGPITLRAGFAKRLHPRDGEWPKPTPHSRSVERSRDTILDALGPDLRWSEIRHAHYRRLWRHLFRAYAADGTGGPRWTEMVCGNLQATANWLQVEGLIEPGDGQPANRWGQAMRKEWEEIVGRPWPDPRKLRYTVAESERLWNALPDADPRLWLGMEIGAELRLGQVIRSRRSDVIEGEGEPLYAVRIHGKGQKEGTTVVLTDDSRAVLRQMMDTGYLSDLEAAYQAGEIADYPLLPGHKMARGKSPVYRTYSLERSGLYPMWKALERIAGVDEVEGRAWYGMRRLQSDQAENVESDARVLNQMGGWKRTATREEYQEKGSLKIAAKAADARRQIRPKRKAEGPKLHPEVTPAENERDNENPQA